MLKHFDTIRFVRTQLVSVNKDHHPTDQYFYFSLVADNKMRTPFVCFLLLISVLVMEAKSISMKKGKITRGLSHPQTRIFPLSSSGRGGRLGKTPL